MFNTAQYTRPCVTPSSPHPWCPHRQSPCIKYCGIMNDESKELCRGRTYHQCCFCTFLLSPFLPPSTCYYIYRERYFLPFLTPNFDLSPGELLVQQNRNKTWTPPLKRTHWRTWSSDCLLRRKDQTMHISTFNLSYIFMRLKKMTLIECFPYCRNIILLEWYSFFGVV